MGVNTKSFDNASDMITFSRASGAYGLTKVGYGSELVSNGDFSSDSDWTKIGTATISGGQANLATTNDEIQQGLAVAGVTYEVRINWTVGTGTYLKLYIGGTYKQVFTSDLTFLITATSAQAFRFIAGNGSATISEISVKEVTYNSSDPSATLKLIYHPNDVPRIEYDLDGTAKGLLVEESRTNLIAYSDLSSGWSETRSTLIQDALTSPEGIDNATALASDLTASNSHRSQSIMGTLSSGTYTFSAYLKRGETNAQLEIYVDPANSVQLRVLYVLFDLSNGTAKTPLETGSPTDVDYGIQDAGNGWYRCYVTTGNPDGTRVDGTITLSDHQVTLQNPVFNGTGNIGVYIYGAQFEAGAFPTSYIKTTGATATRSTDIASIPVADFGYNQSEGTLFVEADTFSTSVNNHQDFNFFQGAVGGSSIHSGSRVGGGVAGQYTLWVQSGGSTVALISKTSAISDNTVYKAAWAASADDFALTVDGATVVTDTSGAMPIAATEARIGYGVYGRLNGHIKSIKYYPRRLTNAQLQELTT